MRFAVDSFDQANSIEGILNTIKYQFTRIAVDICMMLAKNLIRLFFVFSTATGSVFKNSPPSRGPSLYRCLQLSPDEIGVMLGRQSHSRTWTPPNLPGFQFMTV
jgi:hypothetical protein